MFLKDDSMSSQHSNVITSPQNDTRDVRVETGNFIASVNKLNAQFSNVPINIKAQLLQTYCASWHGCQTWALNTSDTEKLNTEWNKAVKRTLGLPRATRTKLLPLLAGQNNFIGNMPQDG